MKFKSIALSALLLTTTGTAFADVSPLMNCRIGSNCNPNPTLNRTGENPLAFRDITTREKGYRCEFKILKSDNRNPEVKITAAYINDGKFSSDRPLKDATFGKGGAYFDIKVEKVTPADKGLYITLINNRPALNTEVEAKCYERTF